MVILPCIIPGFPAIGLLPFAPKLVPGNPISTFERRLVDEQDSISSVRRCRPRHRVNRARGGSRDCERAAAVTAAATGAWGGGRLHPHQRPGAGHDGAGVPGGAFGPGETPPC